MDALRQYHIHTRYKTGTYTYILRAIIVGRREQETTKTKQHKREVLVHFFFFLGKKNRKTEEKNTTLGGHIYKDRLYTTSNTKRPLYFRPNRVLLVYRTQRLIFATGTLGGHI